MINNVTTIRPVKGPAVYPGKDICDHKIPVPIAPDGWERLGVAVHAAGVDADVRGVWMAYPNLREATSKLVGLLSSSWPSAQGFDKSAVIEAVLAAVGRVKGGLERGENGRDFVVANYLAGLGGAAEDLVRLQAWGCIKERPVEQWIHEDKRPFVEWANLGGFTEIRFYRRRQADYRELTGTRFKLLCAVASAKDVGAAARLN